MPLLDNERAVKEYYDEVKDRYPDIDFERFRTICRSPFIFFRNLIRDGDLPKILIKHLGKLRVFPAKVKEQIKKEKFFCERGIIDIEERDRRLNFLETNLIKIYEDLEKDKDDEREATD